MRLLEQGQALSRRWSHRPGSHVCLPRLLPDSPQEKPLVPLAVTTPSSPLRVPWLPRGFAAKKRGYADQLSLLIVLVLSQMNKLAVLLVWCESLENVDNVSLTPQASPPLGGDNYTDCY